MRHRVQDVSVYEWTHETSIGEIDDLSAEDWLRATWEQGPRLLQVLLPIAWKYGLGLRLGSTYDPDRILGWHIADIAPNSVSVDADSRILLAENVLSLGQGKLRWTTNVHMKNLAGRVCWMAAKVAHQWLVPLSLRRAIRLHGG